MKKLIIAIVVTLVTPVVGFAQNYPHYTMFMFNKLIYNPAYAGSRDVTSINGAYRDQWTGIDGAPKEINISVDAPVGNYMKPFRHVALGLSINNEQVGATNNTSAMAYYAYRIQLKSSVLSFGLQAGAANYNANYNMLNPYQTNDQLLMQNIKNAFLPNAGAGVYWYGNNFYAGASIPNLLENYYDKDHKGVNNEASRQLRSYYLSGGYVIPLNENIKLEPQVLGRYAGDGTYNLPFNADLNLSVILYDRLLIGATYRTDKSVEGIIHVQVTNYINIGYAYDYTASALQPYANGSHEVTIGFDLIKDHNKYINPRFVKMF